MNKSIIWTIAYKDMKAITTNSQIWLGMVLLPLILCVILPLILILTAKWAPIDSNDTAKFVATILKALPQGETKTKLESLPSINHQIIYVMVNYMLGSMFLIIPCLNSMMVAANSFVGEKERRTLESLLFAPITVKELFVGKVLSAFLPAITISIVSFILFGIVVNIATAGMFDKIIFPNANWLLLVFWLSPLVALFTILINVLISARVRSFQAAQQLGSTVILPIVALVVAQATGLLLISPLLLFFIGVVLLAGNVFVLRKVTKYNNRNALFERQI
ncbi:ABC transporter permease subunit [Ectobacillus panaciterrae]|uniref:ABC transporter permease subunit n=1 Tax=Ectobacillus panaciterrae TaxID=363872 RepID=UPI00040E81E3|nr:ABC transporter permease subunit [Ectobacillus panaciterrae]